MIIKSKNTKPVGTMIVDYSGIFIYGFHQLAKSTQKIIFNYSSQFPNTLKKLGLFIEITDFKLKKDLASKIGNVLKENVVLNSATSKTTIKLSAHSYELIKFKELQNKALKYAIFLKKETEHIAVSLENFETYNVILDEIDRSIDLLENLDKNKEYFKFAVTNVTAFLPLNQPLYATICFGVIPSLMALDVAIRPPTAIHPHYQKLMSVLKLTTFFKNISISYDQKQIFLEKRQNKSEVVIFTGTYENSQIIYRALKPNLFILNGAGHNPIVVTPKADINSAVDSTLRVSLQNQGQDCAAPNSILVHQDILIEFKKVLLKKLSKINKFVGPYNNRQNIIGPNTEKEHLVQVANWLIDLQKYIIYGGIIDTSQGIIYPTVLEVPLEDKAMLNEFFAPIITIQPYENDKKLKSYFQNPQYYPHAMFVTLFGQSEYVESLTKLGLHTPENIIYNSDLHINEHGYLPYGGLGPEASCLYVNGKRIPGATLPQRDIYKYLAKLFN